MPPEQNEFDKRLSTKLKRFSSERNLFFSNLYNSEFNGEHRYKNNSNQLNQNSNKNNNNVVCNDNKYGVNNNNNINHLNKNSNNNNSHNDYNNSNTNNNNNTMYKNINNNNCNKQTNIHVNANKNKENLVTATAPQNVAEKLKGRVERTKSFFINGFMKRCKSSKDLFSSSSSNEFNIQKETKKAAAANTITDNSATNNKLLNNLDEFERNFLSSAGKKILVRELRKNFESATSTGVASLSASIQTPLAPTLTETTTTSLHIPSARQPPQPSPPPRSSTTPLIRLWKSKSSVSTQKRPPIKKKVNDNNNATIAEVQQHSPSSAKTTTATASSAIASAPSTTTIDGNKESPKKALLSRHSFYNTYRNEYLATSDKHSSNLSLNFCGTKPSITAGNGMKSSSTLNTPFHRFSDCNFTRSVSTANLSTTTATMDRTLRNGPSSFSHSVYSINSLADNNSLSSYNDIYDNSADCHYINNHRMRNELGSSTTSIHTVPQQHSMLCHSNNNNFNDNSCDVISVASNNNNTTIEFNNSNGISGNNNYTDNDGDDNNEEDLFKIYVQCNNKINNINNSNVKLRKCNSVNQIDLDMLRNELDDFIDMKWRSTNLCMGFHSQRRYLYRKVNIIQITNIFLYYACVGLRFDLNIQLLVHILQYANASTQNKKPIQQSIRLIFIFFELKCVFI